MQALCHKVLSMTIMPIFNSSFFFTLFFFSRYRWFCGSYSGSATPLCSLLFSLSPLHRLAHSALFPTCWFSSQFGHCRNSAFPVFFPKRRNTHWHSASRREGAWLLSHDWQNHRFRGDFAYCYFSCSFSHFPSWKIYGDAEYNRWKNRLGVANSCFLQCTSFGVIFTRFPIIDLSPFSAI